MTSRPLVPNGTYRIKSASSNTYLDSSPGPSVIGNPTASNSASQQWTISPARDGDYEIKSAANGQDLLINSLNQLFCGPSTRKVTWTIEPRGSDAYVFGNAIDTRAIQLPSRSGPVTVENRNNGTRQRWILEPDPLGLQTPQSLSGTWHSRVWDSSRLVNETTYTLQESGGVLQGQGTTWAGPFTDRLLSISGNAVQIQRTYDTGRYQGYQYRFQGNIAVAISGTWSGTDNQGQFVLSRF